MPKSTIWRHFTEIDSDKKVICLYCPQQLSVANKSTCSLIRHLTKKHPNLKIRRLSSTKAQRSQEEVLLVNNDTDVNSKSPEGPVLEYEIVEQEDSDVEDGNGSELKEKPPQRIIPSKTTKPNLKPAEQQVIVAMTEAKSRIEDALISLKSLNKRQMDDEDEYDNFGKLMASKIRKIQDIDKREIVMHSVYNVVYDALIKNV